MAAEEKLAMPTEEDAAPRIGNDGQALTDHQKGEILQAIDEKKREEKKAANAIVAEKKAAKFNIAKGKDAGSTSGADKTPAGGGFKAVKALSPEKATDGKGKAKAGESPAGGGAKAVAALKTGGGAKGGGKGKAAAAGGKGKKGGLLAAAKEAADATPEAPAPAAEPEPPPETAEERVARLKKEEEEREAERTRLYNEREAQRAEIEQAIWAEERRLREKEKKKREKEALERKKQQAFRDAAFDGELDDVKKQIDEWCEETMSDLIGAKVDCMDAQKSTALSEAACAGNAEICALLLKHGASINLVNSQKRTPLWRAAFMDKSECVELLLKNGGDPRLKSDNSDTPAMVAPSGPLKELLNNWDEEETDRILADVEKRLEKQWKPPPPDPEDQPAGQAGYFLQCPMTQFQDALDAVTKESDRPCFVADLGGKIGTYFSYRDCNMHCYARPGDIEPDRLRIGLLGALRFGKPMVLDMMSLDLDEDTIQELFDAVRPGLWRKILNKSIMKQEHYDTLKTGEEDETYGSAYWSESTTAHYQFVLLSKHPLPPEWAQEAFFVIRST